MTEGVTPPDVIAPPPPTAATQVQATHARSYEQRRVRFSGLVAALTALIGLAFALFSTTHTDPVPLVVADSPESIGVVIAAISLLVGMVAPVFGYRRLVKFDEDLSPVEREAAARSRNYIGRLGVAVAVGLLAFGASILAIWLLENMFPGVTLTRLTVWLIALVYSGALGFGLSYWIVTVTTDQVFRISIAMILVGIGVGAMTAADREWWKNSLSFMGHDNGAAMFFNMGLILGGMLMLSVAVDIANELRVLRDAGRFPTRNFDLVRVWLYTICLCLSGIGLFPSAVTVVSDILHQVAANGMVSLIVLLMLSVSRVVPMLPHEFDTLSLIFGGICVLIVVLFILGALNFVALEIFLTGTCLVWIFLFKTRIRVYIRGQVLDAAMVDAR
ncbi:MAG TPA: hypothetical protein PLD47_10550 [Aggregatilineales bacterium]|nr:hypothetical protein [Anaerolineales bacterium]HRE48154.1 hypothetical protein [Aggregatilineales bacterium]